MLKNDGGSRLFAGLTFITEGYSIGPDYLAWDHRTRLEKDKKARVKERAGRLELFKLKKKVDVVLTKGATPEAGKWNNCDLKTLLQWFKRNGNTVMPNKKEGFMLCYCKTQTCLVHDGGNFPHGDMAATVADCQEASHSASSTATAASQANSKTFALVAAGSQSAAYVDPIRVDTGTSAAATPTFVATSTTATAAIIIDSEVVSAVVPTVFAMAPRDPTYDCQPNSPPNSYPIDWGR
jgi:hypothetical protein